tara:strand:+ start:995 stop:1909 length:915 start_codon:yes stop_codon:yes gene_type:complete
MRNFLIDTDTGSDDAVALAMALNNSNIKIEAITVVAGNIPVEQGLQNALYTVELCNKKTPVYLGEDKPLKRSLRTSEFFHGQDGLGDIGLDLKGRKATDGNAIDIIIEKVYEFENNLEIVAIGPLTNLALTIKRDPKIISKIKNCFIMGGTAFGPGNITPFSEFNFWVDPEAAKIVLQSGMEITLIDWDATKKYAWFDSNTIKSINNLNTPLSKFSMDIQNNPKKYKKKKYGNEMIELADPLAMAIALDPSIIIKSKKYNVNIDLSNKERRGENILNEEGEKNTTVILKASRKKFLDIFKKSLK